MQGTQQTLTGPLPQLVIFHQNLFAPLQNMSLLRVLEQIHATDQVFVIVRTPQDGCIDELKDIAQKLGKLPSRCRLYFRRFELTPQNHCTVLEGSELSGRLGFMCEPIHSNVHLQRLCLMMYHVFVQTPRKRSPFDYLESENLHEPMVSPRS